MTLPAIASRSQRDGSRLASPQPPKLHSPSNTPLHGLGMSCSAQQPSEFDPTHAFPEDHDALSSDTDYGSDFSADEADLLNQLLAQVDASEDANYSPNIPAVAVNHHVFHENQQSQTRQSPDRPIPSREDPAPVRPSTANATAPLPAAIPDIEDLGNDAPDRVPRVLGRGRTPPVWEIQIAGGALPEPGTHRASWVPVLGGTAIVEHPDSTEGRERQRERDIAREQEMIANANANAEETPAEPKNHVVDTRSPIERFRRPPMKAFSVTDLVSPAWCEVQYWYILTKHGRKRRTPAMKKGTTMHKTLEDEIYTTVPVEVTTKEDAFALRIWNVIQGLRTLREFGITRELEVWGLVDGELVNGIIDQLSYECPDPELEDSAASHYAEVAASRAVMPEYQMSLNDYLLSPAHGGRRIDDMSVHEMKAHSAEGPGSSESSELQHIPRIFLTDVKTRGSKSTPTVKSSSFRPTMLQLQLYYHMLTRLITSDDVTIDTLASRYGLDQRKPFTDAFIAEVGSLNDRFFDALTNLEFDPDCIPTPEDALTRHQSQNSEGTEANEPPPASQDSTSVLLAHSNLTRLWKLMKDQLRLTFLPQSLSNTSVAPSIPSEFQPPMLESYPTILSPLLTAKYISSAATADLQPRVLGSRSFLFDPTSLEAYLADQMNWWRGHRTPRGVEVMEAWKCRICEFSDECEWRQEREWAYARKKGYNVG